MSRLTWRQRLIAIAIGVAAAILQSKATAPRAGHAAAATAAACTVQAIGSC